MLRFRRNRGASIMEYMALLMLLMGALYIFQFYIVRGLSGRWKKAGDAFAYGRQYDPRPWGNMGSGKGTLACFWDVNTNDWISESCFDTNCDCTLPTYDPNYPMLCTQCKINCSASVLPAASACRE